MERSTAVSIREEIASLLTDFAGQGKTLTIPRPYLDLCGGDHLKALFFSQLVYWSGSTGKWFFKSYEDWEFEVGLSERQVRRIVRELQDEKIVETYFGKEGIRPVLHYRVVREFLAEWTLTKRQCRVLPNVSVESDVTSPSYKEHENHVHEHHEHDTSVGFISSTQTPITEATIKWLSQRFKSAGRKLSGPEKRALSEWLSEREETEEQLEMGVAGFLQDSYWAGKNFPVDAFKKQFQKYLDQGPLGAPVDLPPIELQPIPVAAAPQPAAAPTTDALFDEYIEIFKTGGKPIGEHEKGEAVQFWNPLTEEQRQRSCADARRVCADTTDPKFIPSPKNHLKQKPWTREAMARAAPVKKETNSQRSLRLLTEERKHQGL